MWVERLQKGNIEKVCPYHVPPIGLVKYVVIENRVIGVAVGVVGVAIRCSVFVQKPVGRLFKKLFNRVDHCLL